jgi:hypothetical protein
MVLKQKVKQKEKQKEKRKNNKIYNVFVVFNFFFGLVRRSGPTTVELTENYWLSFISIYK